MFESALILENFIVIEGIDGSGTTTQLELIDKELARRSVPHIKTCEPTSGDIGGLIRSILSGSVRVRPETLAYLFAADRYEHVYDPANGIIARHSLGDFIISDRYLFSSLAYQSIECNPDLVIRLNEQFPLPSLLFFIDVPLDTCMERLSHRGETEIFEKRSFQEKVIDSYKRSLALFSGTKMHIHTIDGTLSKEAVFGKIWEIIASMPIFKS